MAFEKIRKYPTVSEIIQSMPISGILKKIKKERDREIADILKGKSNKFLLIIGPCSADNEDAVCEYVRRLAKVQEKVKEKLILIPRIYTNKPRTTGLGYKGMFHQPDPQKKPNLVEGLKSIRKMHIRAFEESYLSAADEMLYPNNYPYLEDLLSYVAVGARSVENQQHRLTASGLDVPVGMKNPTSGDFEIMLNAVQAAQSSHYFIYNGWEVQTTGNNLAHCILRGATNHYGKHIPNYHYEDLILLAEKYESRNLKNPAIIVDTNHSNSRKMYFEQPRIAREVILNMKYSPILKKLIKGLMVESYLIDGKQEIGGTEFGKSITDPCLGWEKSEKLIYEIAESLP